MAYDEDSIEARMDRALGLKPDNATPSNVNVQTAGGNTNVVVNVPKNDNTKTQFNLICETCGSTDVHMINSSMGICKHCGAKIVIKPPAENAPVKINIINATAKVGADSNQDYNLTIETPYYVLPTKYTEEDFFRNMVVFLSALRDTPADILDSEFGKVQTRYSQFMISQYHVEGSYSASIGYDRYVKYGNEERRVTDWHPHSGTIAKDAEAKIKLGMGAFEGYMGESTPDADAETTFEVMFDPAILENEAEKFEDSNLNLELVTPSSIDEDRSERKAETWAERTIGFPGNRHEDVRTNFSTELLSRKFVIAPEFVLPFKKDGKEYQQNSFATWFIPIGMRGANFIQDMIDKKFGPVFNRWDLPTIDPSENRYPSIKNERNKIVTQQTQKYGYSAILLSMLSMLLAFAFPFMTISISNLGPLWLLLGVASMTLSIAGYFLYKKMLKQKEIRFYQLLLKEKMARLEAYLERNNMEPLYEEEKELFEYKVG